MGRRARIQEKDSSGTVTSDKRLVWCGKKLVEERDGITGSVTKRYFARGVQIGTSKYFYTRDHLGSIREVLDNSGVIRARYDYDPYGRRGLNQNTTGPIEADFGFSGSYYHSRSGLCLTHFRPYDSDSGRWLSRDPANELGGLNLYGYCFNDPLNEVDTEGDFIFVIAAIV